MFKNFSKIQYSLNGNTLEFTDIFKSITVDKSGFSQISVTNNNTRYRPDQFSSKLYQNQNLYSTIFLMNDIKNPFKQWNQSPDALLKQNIAEFDSWTFQFLNASRYLPSASNYIDSSSLDSYLGVTLSDILEDDILVYETGNGAFKLKAFGAGSVYSTNSCDQPHYGQSLIPDNFVDRNSIFYIGAGGNFSAGIDPVGRIWGWGQTLGLTGFSSTDRLYKSQDSGYTAINVTKNKIIGNKTNKTWYCYGSGCTSSLSYPVTESKSISQIEFTKGNTFSGVVLFSDNTVKFYGGLTYTQSVTNITDVSCAENYCLGIIGDSGANQGKVTEFTYTGISAGLIPTISTKISKIACGKDHALLLDETGNIHFVGSSTYNRTEIPSGTYIDISAGERHSAAINSNNKLYVAGQILQQSGSCSGTTAYVSINTIPGEFNQVVSGDNHVLLLGSGTAKKHLGKVTFVDNDYKRIIVKSYSGPDTKPVLIDETSGTLVGVIRGDKVVKTIQHQLFSIDSYLNTTQSIKNENNEIINVAANNGSLWKSVFITGYKDHANNPLFLTPIKIQKELIQYQNTIKYLQSTKAYDLMNAVDNAVKTQNIIKIKLSDI